MKSADLRGRAPLPQEETLSTSKPAALLLISLCLVLVALISENIVKTVRANDDMIWYYFIGGVKSDPALGARERAFYETLPELTDSPLVLARARIHLDLAANYTLTSLIYYHGGNVLAAASGASNYPQFLSRAILFGVLLTNLVVIGAFGTGLLYCSENVQIATAATVVAKGLLSLLAVDASYQVLSPDDPLNAKFLLILPFRFIEILVDPHFGVSLFGAVARNSIIVLTLLVFALRWSGRPFAGYAILLLMLFIHQAMAGLVFAVVLLCDAVLAPERLLSRKAAIVLGLVLVLVAAREWSSPSLSVTAWSGFLIALLAVPTSAFLVRAVQRRDPGFVRWFIGSMARLPKPWAIESLVLILAAVAVWALAVPGNALADYMTRLHFWSLLPARFAGILAPVLFLAGFIYLMRAHTSLRHVVGIATAAAAILLTAVSAAAILKGDGVSAPRKMTAQLEALDKALSHHANVGMTTFQIEDEALLYYALLKGSRDDADYVARIWRTSP